MHRIDVIPHIKKSIRRDSMHACMHDNVCMHARMNICIHALGTHSLTHRCTHTHPQTFKHTF